MIIMMTLVITDKYSFEKVISKKRQKLPVTNKDNILTLYVSFK